MSLGDEQEPILLSYEEAVSLLPEGSAVHTFRSTPGALLGADMGRTELLALLRSSTRREVAGPAAQAMRHGLAVLDGDGEPLFVETKQEGE